MIEELKLIQEMVGDLSAVGGWVAGGYILYKVLVDLVLFVGLGWLVNSISKMIYAHVKSDITKKEADDIRASKTRMEAEHYAEKKKLQSDIERVKHLYKILKESTKVEDDGL